MTTYNNNNIKAILNLLDINFKGGLKERSFENLVWRAEKLKINKQEAIDSLNLLLDLKVIQGKEKMIGDGWNTRDTCKYYSLT